MKRRVGLDLGAAKCCVAIADGGNVAVLPDARGDKTTPSFVAFNECRTLVGSDARDQANVNCENTVYGIKTVLGRTIGDLVVDKKLSSDFKFTLPDWQKGEDGVPIFQLHYRNKKLNLRPAQITALLIGKMKSMAERSVGSDVTGAVISVPVSYNTAQRQATLDAARIAGFINATLVNCTTAAAVAYWDHNRRENDCVAVIDFGAGSVNFAIIAIRDGRVVVQDAFGDCSVGGNDIDLRMMSVLEKKFYEENSIEFQWSRKPLLRLRSETEALKHKLTLLPTANIQVDAFCGEVDLTTTFTRQEMVESCKEVFDVVKLGLTRLKRSEFWKNVRCAVLVGGSTRIPAVQNMMSSTLGIPLDQSLNKDEAVASGAALVASSKALLDEVEDIVGRRIWCESSTDSVVVDVHTPVPAEKAYEGPPPWDVKVWEKLTSLQDGKSETFELCALSMSNENQLAHQERLLFSVNESGVFRAETIRAGKSSDVPLKIASLDADALSDCVETHDGFLRDEKELLENENAVNDLESLCFEKLQIMKEKDCENEELKSLLDHVLQWLEDTPDATTEQCNCKRSEIEGICADKHEDNLSQKLGKYQRSDQTEPIETISCEAGRAGREHSAAPAHDSRDSRLNSRNESMDSEPSVNHVSNSSDYNKNFLEKTDPSVVIGQPSTQPNGNCRAPPTGPPNQNGALRLWSEGTRQPRAGTTHAGQQHVTYPKPGALEKNAVGKEASLFYTGKTGSQTNGDAAYGYHSGNPVRAGWTSGAYSGNRPLPVGLTDTSSELKSQSEFHHTYHVTPQSAHGDRNGVNQAAGVPDPSRRKDKMRNNEHITSGPKFQAPPPVPLHKGTNKYDARNHVPQTTRSNNVTPNNVSTTASELRTGPSPGHSRPAPGRAVSVAGKTIQDQDASQYTWKDSSQNNNFEQDRHSKQRKHVTSYPTPRNSGDVPTDYRRDGQSEYEVVEMGENYSGEKEGKRLELLKRMWKWLINPKLW